MTDSLLRLDDVLAYTRLSRSFLYALIKCGLFPHQRKITGTRCVRWNCSDIQQWVNEQAGKAPPGLRIP